MARQAAIGAGLPPAVGATTVNKVCGSGLKAVMLAAQAIQCGDSRTVVAGGTENMSAAPYLLPKARTGYRLGNGELIDTVIRDGLWDVYNNLHMGICGDRCARRCGISRQEQDDFAVASYQRAIQAQQDGLFAEEIVPVEIAGRKETIVVDKDEEPQRFNEEKLRALRPAFDPEGTVTAGNASSLNDGAAAVVVLSGEPGQGTGRAAPGPHPRLHHLQPGAGVVHPGPDRRHPPAAGAAQAGGGRRGPVRDQRGVFRGALGGDEGTAASRTRRSTSTAARSPWDIPSAPAAPASWSPCCTPWRRRQGKVGIASLCIGGGEAVAMAVERCD